MFTARSPAAGVTASATVEMRGGRRLALAVLTGSELLLVLDATIVNVALPAIAGDLRLASSELQWVVTAYVLAFGGFLLLGGRLADRFGPRRMFVAAASVFALGSLLAALAASLPVLVAGRALQGLAAAVLGPAALSLLMMVFAPGRDRDRALGIWAGVTASGMALGLLLGGVLTQALSWRWVFWATVPVAVGAGVCALVVLPKARNRDGRPFDLLGAVLGTGAITALVYTLVRTPELGWTSAVTLSMLVLAVALLAAFVGLQRVRADSLIPTQLLGDRTVLGADLVGIAYGVAIYALLYFLSLFLAGPLGFSALQTGLAFLPFAAAVAAGAQAAGTVLRRVAPRTLLLAGTLLVAGGLAVLGTLHARTGYLTTLLPALVAVGLGMGLAFVALTSAAVGTVAAQDSGVASGLFKAGQQIGGALGLAALTAVSTARAQALTPTASNPGPDAVTAGWSSAFLVAAVVMVIAVLVTTTMIRRE